MILSSSQLVLRCHVKGIACLLCSMGVVEPTRKAVLLHVILVGRCLVNARPQLPVLLLNPGKAPVFIPAGSFIVLVKPVCYIDDQKVDGTFLAGTGPRLSNPAVETGAKSHPVCEVVYHENSTRNPYNYVIYSEVKGFPERILFLNSIY